MGSPVTLRGLIAEAIGNAMGTMAAIENADNVATEFEKSLRTRHLALHDTAKCIRMPEPQGRPMTASEVEMVRHG